jgi:hypothetical protein
MKTLTIDVDYSSPLLRLKGLSFKALSGTSIESDVIIGDSGYYEIQTDYALNALNRNTAKIAAPFLIDALAEICERIPFDKIKILGHYELTADQLMDAVIKKVKENNDF